MVMLFSFTLSNAQDIVRKGNEFSVISNKKESKDMQTKFTYKDSKGKIYPIYITSRNKCYIIRTSKNTGKEYKSYLPKDITEQIVKELKK